MTRLAPPERPQAPSTLIRCVRCGQLVEVVELPGPHIDPAGYVGVCCLRPVRDPSVGVDSRRLRESSRRTHPRRPERGVGGARIGNVTAPGELLQEDAVR